MLWILVLNVAIRAVATSWSLVLTVRLRDWRWAALSALLAVVTLRAAVAQPAGSPRSGSVLLYEATTLAVSILALVTVYLLRAASSRQARESTFARAFRSSPDAIVLSALPEGRIFETNRSLERVIGYSPQDAIGRTSKELRLWVDPAERDGLMEELKRTGEVRDLDIQLRHKTGEVRRCQVSAEVIEVAGEPTLLSILRDVTSYKRAEAALQASEAMFSKVFSASPDAITITSLDGGEFIEINESFTQITGHDRATTLGRTSAELGLWADLAGRDELRQKLREQGSISNREVTFSHRSGRPIHCLVSADVIEFAGEPNLLMTVRDITERAAILRELEAKNAELERYAYTLSHDLKSPLVTINGFLGLLKRDLAVGDHEKANHDLERVRQAATRMSQLVDELLELSRIGRVANPHEELSLCELARVASEMVAGQLAAGDVSIEIDPKLPVVRGDRSRLLEVLQNLIDNAVKFMGSQERPHIEVGSRQQGEETVFYVRDNGTGIDSRYHEKVFELFDRLDPRIEGTGVGLALVKRIIEVHGGRVWVESEGLGHGSTMCFTLSAAAVSGAIES